MDTVSRVSRGLAHLPPGSVQVVDADEEVFLLYTDLAGKPGDLAGGSHGLGFLDSHQDTLTIAFDLRASDNQSTHGKNAGKKTHRKEKVKDASFEIQLVQDKTALRSRKGDTGSVLWRASVELAQMLLRRHYANSMDALLDRDKMQQAHILELGAGTGLLAIALSRLVRQYTVTDIEALMPLIRKNLNLNLPGWENSLSKEPRGTQSATGHTITANALDWLTLHKCPPNTRKSVYSYDAIDLLLVVDCIYHPSLLPALVESIDYLSTPEQTTVLVVVELRAEDVVREFLELWLNASGQGVWEVWHVDGIMEGPYAAWIGWKRIPRI